MSLKHIFLVLAFVSAVVGFGAMFLSHGKSSFLDMTQGVFKGLAGVFFILYYILMLLGKQPLDKTGSH